MIKPSHRLYNNRFSILLFILIGSFLSLCSKGQTTEKGALVYYISPEGNDSCTGNANTPLKSIQQAQALAMPYFGKREIQFVFMDGIHHLDSTIVINNDQSGSETCPVTYRAQNMGKAVICGSGTLSLQWQPWNDSIYMAEVTDSLPYIDQLYVNGKLGTMARYPNRTGKRVFDCWDLVEKAETDSLLDVFNPLRIASWEHPEGAYLHAMYNQMWGDVHWKVSGVKENELTYEGEEFTRLTSILHPVYKYVENVFEELDTPGEWFYNTEERRIYYYPHKDEKIEESTFEYARLTELIRFQGFSSSPILSTTISGLTFRHSARTFLEKQAPLLRSDLSISRKAAVNFEGTKQCKIEYCEFDGVGGNAICVNRYNRELLIYGCYIHDNGANGIAFIGSPSAVRNPLYAYDTPNYLTMDRIPGPKNNIYPANCRVEDCLITRTGRIEKQTAPILLSMAYAITINHCSIYDVPRSGITISDGTFGGHIIEYCDVFNTVQETSALGSFSSWGRDRYWSPLADQTVEEVKKDQLLPTLDMIAPNILRNNRWSCDRGYAINLDEGSSNYEIYNNILLNGGLKLHSGYYRIVTNNVLVNNSLHPQLWYDESGDVFKHNIVADAYQPKAMNVCMADSSQWGKEIDYNFFASNDSTVLRFKTNLCDLHSQVGSPQFRDAEKGDFRIDHESSASKLGFQNFYMRSFGVMLPILKKIRDLENKDQEEADSEE